MAPLQRLAPLLLLPLASAEVSQPPEDSKSSTQEVKEFLDETGCIFGWYTWSGKPCNEEGAMDQEREDEYEALIKGHRCKDEKLQGTLDEFCGITFGEDDVVACPCCADHLHAQMPRRAALLVPGERTKTVAWNRNDEGDFCRMGHLPIWSMGGDRVPMLWCDSGVLKCECFDPSRDWHEDEPRCATGRRCAAPGLLQERVSARSAAGVTLDASDIAVGDRIRAKVDIFYPPGHVCLKDEPSGLTLQPGAKGTVTSLSADSDIDMIVEWDQIGTMGTDCLGAGAVVYHDQIQKFEEDQESDAKPEENLPPCTALDKVKSPEADGEEPGELAGGQKRLSIGSRHCDAMTAEQCNGFYSTKVLDNGQRIWHYCSVDHHGLRLCGAEVLKEDEAAKRALDWQSFAVDYAYLPTRDWPIVLKDETFRVDSGFVPSGEELQEALHGMRLFHWVSPGSGTDWVRKRWAKHHWKHHRRLMKEERNAGQRGRPWALPSLALLLALAWAP